MNSAAKLSQASVEMIPSISSYCCTLVHHIHMASLYTTITDTCKEQSAYAYTCCALFDLCAGLLYALEEDMRDAVNDLKGAITVP